MKLSKENNRFRIALPPFLLIVVPFFSDALHISLFFVLFIPLFCLIVFLLSYLIFRNGYLIGYYNLIKPLLNYILILLLIYFLQILLNMSNLGPTLYSSMGYLFSLSIIVYFSHNSNNNSIDALQIIFLLTGILFLIQFTFSIWESIGGTFFFGDVDWVNIAYSTDQLESRVLLKIITSNLSFLSIFKQPFTGMLGQWNYWGTQLPIYNLIFWYMYLGNKNRFFKILLFLVPLASFLNTSRFGIFAIIITSLIMYLIFVNGKKFLLYLFTFLFIYIFINNYNFVDKGLDVYMSQGADTLTPRLEQYNLFFDRVSRVDLVSLFLGVGLIEGENYAIRLAGFVNSFESEFFSKIFITGIISLLAFFGLILSLFFKAKLYVLKFRVISYLLAFNIVSVSIISNLVFTVYIFPFITLLYISLVLHNYNKNLK